MTFVLEIAAGVVLTGALATGMVRVTIDVGPLEPELS